jgi:hypothetical protein
MASCFSVLASNAAHVTPALYRPMRLHASWICCRYTSS